MTPKRMRSAVSAGVVCIGTPEGGDGALHQHSPTSCQGSRAVVGGRVRYVVVSAARRRTRCRKDEGFCIVGDVVLGFKTAPLCGEK
jgi:hypothetical protein